MNTSSDDKRPNLDACAAEAVRHATIGILLAGDDEQILDANPAAARLYGAEEPAALVGTRLYAGDDSPAPDFGAMLDADAPTSLHLRQHTAFGADFECDCTFVPLGPDGANRLLVMMSDARGRLTAESKLFQSGRLSLLRDMVRGVAHELNNPLTAILGHSELLVHRIDDERVKKSVGEIRSETERCRKIVGDLMGFSTESGTSPELTDLNTLLTETAELCAYQMRLAKIAIRYSLSEGLPPLLLQRAAMQRAFLAVMVNAHQALASVPGREREFHVQTVDEGETVCITFKDNGPGMSPEVLSKAIDPFFTTRPVGAGVGLGLSVAYGAVREHGGDMDIHSQPGNGTAVIVRLPKSDTLTRNT